jgi:hypothetical protein
VDLFEWKSAGGRACWSWELGCMSRRARRRALSFVKCLSSSPKYSCRAV